jgi:hypothetical protein
MTKQTNEIKQTNKPYEVIIDYGKPYSEFFNTEQEVLNYLKELEQQHQTEDYAYLDIHIFKNGELIKKGILKNE